VVDNEVQVRDAGRMTSILYPGLIQPENEQAQQHRRQERSEQYKIISTQYFNNTCNGGSTKSTFHNLVELNKYISIESLAPGGHAGIGVIGAIRCADDHRASLNSD